MTLAEPNTPAFERTTWWCTEDKCHGEHHAYIEDPVPATAHTPRPSEIGGFWAPGVRVRLGWNTVDHQQTCVWLHIGGEEADERADLHVQEAKLLVETPQRAIAELEGRRP
jgi:hypothetical protein